MQEPLETQPSPTGAWSLAGEGPRRRRPVLLGLGLVLALVAALAGWQVLRPGGEAVALAYALAEGQSERYRIEMAVEGTVTAEDLGLPEQPISTELEETLSWTVTDVDDEGVATVRVAVEGVTGTANGQPVPADAVGLETQIRLGPDGRVLSAGGLSFASGGDLPGGLPGMDQMTPLLPDHPVAPGDTWEKTFSQEVPFGEGELVFTTESTFVGYEEVEGVRAAVITSRVRLPLDLSVNLGEMLATLAGEDDGPSREDLTGAEMTYVGDGRFTTTGWLDPQSGLLLRSQTRGAFSMTVGLAGLPDVPDGSEVRMDVRITQEVRRLK